MVSIEQMCEYNYGSLKPIHGEKQYVEYDDDTLCWGIFGLKSGYCYELYSTEFEANERLENIIKGMK